VKASARLRPVENVRCLDCGKVYAKPTGRGTLSTNPGCPECGYVGWLPTVEWLTPGWPRARFAVNRRPRLRQRSG
jgi:phage FluMu protein Com